MALNNTYLTYTDYNVSVSNNDTMEGGGKTYVYIVNGYVVPSLALFVLLVNAVVIAVLRRQQTYGASQAGLVSVAVSDTLTLILPGPFYFYSYGLDHSQFLYGCTWCEAMDVIALYLPTISHTASIWLTVLLTFQRYIYVCLPFKARTLCTLRNTTIAIIMTYLLAFIVHLCRFTVFEYEDMAYYDPEGNYTFTFCRRDYRSWIDVSVYLSSYMSIRIVFIQFVPCVVLIFLNCKILHGLKGVTRKRLAMHNNAESNHATVKENNRVTVMIITMAVLTLLVEFPAGIIQLFYLFPFMFGITLLQPETLEYVEIIANLIIIFSYPLNFLLYCSMSAEFKATLKELCFGTCTRPTDKTNSKKGCVKVPTSPTYSDKATSCSKL